MEYTPRKILETTPGGLEVVTFGHPVTKQRVRVLGSPHPDHDPGLPIFEDIAQQWQDFIDRVGVGAMVQVVVEGRLPIFNDNGKVEGERPPAIAIHDKDSREKVILAHGDIGVVARLGKLGCHEVITGEVKDADQSIAEELEDEGYDRLSIMRYYVYRQIPQWARSARKVHPDLIGYLKEDVVERCRKALDEVWPDFDFSLDSIVPRELLDTFDQPPTEEMVAYFLNETVGVMYGLQEAKTLSPVQQVAKAYNMQRTTHFADLLKNDWGARRPIHKFAIFGYSHVRALSNILDDHYGNYGDTRDLVYANPDRVLKSLHLAYDPLRLPSTQY